MKLEKQINNYSNNNNNNNTLYSALRSFVCMCFDFTIGRRRNLDVEVAAGQRQGSAQPVEGQGQTPSIKPWKRLLAGRKAARKGLSIAHQKEKVLFPSKKTSAPPCTALEGPIPLLLCFVPPSPNWRGGSILTARDSPPVGPDAGSF